MATTAHKVFTNTLGQAVLRIFEVLIGVITLGLITRYLGQIGFGYYTTVNAVLQFFIIAIDLGLYLTLLREISANPDDRSEFITNNIFTMRVASTVLFLILAIICIAFTPYPQEIKTGAILLSASFLFTSLVSTLTALFQKHLQMVKIASINVINKILFFVSVIVIISRNMGLGALFISSSVVSALSFIMIVVLVAKLPGSIRLRFSFIPSYWKEVLKKTWPIAVTTALNLIYFKADTIILSLYQSQESVGIYGASYRVLEIIVTFPHMFMGLILPILTTAWIAGDRSRLTMVWQKALTFFAFITLPLVTGTYVVGKPLMVLIAGSDFELSGSIIKVLMIATAAIFFGTLYTYMVLVIERQRHMVKYFFLTACVSLVGYFIFIPRYSYWGAAWVTVFSELSIILGAWLVIRNRVTLPIPWAALAKLSAASLLMAVVAWKLQGFMTVIPLILVSGIVYFLLTILTGALSLKDLKELIKPNRGNISL